MALTNMIDGATGFISGVAQRLIFWRNWSKLSQTLLLVIFVLAFFGYMWIKSEVNSKQNKFMKHKRRF